MSFAPSTWAQPVQDIVKEYEAKEAAEMALDIQSEPEAISKSMVRRGVLDPNTGFLLNSKASKITQDNARGFSFIGKKNYERIFGHA